MKIAFLVMAIVGFILVYGSTITGIGVALYGLAYGTAVGMALWNGFVVFLKMLIGGLVLAFVGGVGADS